MSAPFSRALVWLAHQVYSGRGAGTVMKSCLNSGRDAPKIKIGLSCHLGPSARESSAKAHRENDPATPKPGLSDRITESSTQPSTSAVIFDPAGIDVHKKILAVVVSDVEIDSEFHFERRWFGSNPEQLRALAAWLLEQEVEEVVMEST